MFLMNVLLQLNKQIGKTMPALLLDTFNGCYSPIKGNK